MSILNKATGGRRGSARRGSSARSSSPRRPHRGRRKAK